MRFGSIFNKSRPKRKIQMKRVRVDNLQEGITVKMVLSRNDFFEEGVGPGKRSLNTLHNILI